jgi:hypothetical protein
MEPAKAADAVRKAMLRQAQSNDANVSAGAALANPASGGSVVKAASVPTVRSSSQTRPKLPVSQPMLLASSQGGNTLPGDDVLGFLDAEFEHARCSGLIYVNVFEDVFGSHACSH